MKQLIFEHRLFSKKQNSVVCHLVLIDPICSYRQTALTNGHGTENVVCLELKLCSWGKRWDLLFHLYISCHEKKLISVAGQINSWVILVIQRGDFGILGTALSCYQHEELVERLQQTQVICHLFQTIALW